MANLGQEIYFINGNKVEKRAILIFNIKTWLHGTNIRKSTLTSKFGPREVYVGSVAINAASQSFIALCRSLR